MRSPKTFMRLLLFIVCSVFVFLHIDAQDNYVYWFEKEGDYIIRGNLETSTIDTLGRLVPRSISAFDVVNGEFYWFDNPWYAGDSGYFRKGDPQEDGSDALFEAEVDNQVSNLQVDIQNKFVYWIDYFTGVLRRGTLSGDIIETLVPDAFVVSFRIDTAGGKLYWAESAGMIRKAGPDGMGAVDVITGIQSVGDFDIDVLNGRIYWSDAVDSAIYRANIDGSEPEKIIEDVDAALVALDIIGGKIFWAGEPGIHKASLDGSQREMIVPRTSPFMFRNLRFDPIDNSLYWNELGYMHDGNRIMRADAEGEIMEEALSGFGSVYDAAIDPHEEKIYWTTGMFLEIMKADLDGTRVRGLLRLGVALGTPQMGHLAFDSNTGILYWGYTFGISPTGFFSQATTEGTDFETRFYQQYMDFVVSSFFFDPINKWIYLSASSMAKEERTIIRVRSDDPGAEDPVLIIGEGNQSSAVTGIALDFQTGTITWTEGMSGVIRRANLDGSDIVDVLTGLEFPQDLRLDVHNQKLYWIERRTGIIRRADLDGSNPEDLFTGQSSPSGLALPFENNGEPTSVVEPMLPDKFSLMQNYPNPFNPVTTIEYTLPEPVEVMLEVFDVLGRRVSLLVNEEQKAGTYKIQWDASNASSGIYIYRLSAGKFVQSRTMMMLK